MGCRENRSPVSSKKCYPGLNQADLTTFSPHGGVPPPRQGFAPLGPRSRAGLVHVEMRNCRHLLEAPINIALIAMWVGTPASPGPEIGIKCVGRGVSERCS